MSHPTIRFVDAEGVPFKVDEDGITHVRQFGGAWSVQLEETWSGGVALYGTPPMPLVKISNTNQWELPRERGRKVIRRSGEVTVVLTDRAGNVVKNGAIATLHIYPAGISEEQINQMVSDIGTLALSTACCVRRAVPVPIGEGFGMEGFGQQWLAGKGMLATATALLDLASVVQDNWSEIQKRPLRSVITEVGAVEIGKASASPQLLIRAKVEPDKRRVLGMTRSESTQCPENEFLCYVLDVYLRDLAIGLAVSLESLSLGDVEDSLIPTRSRRDDEQFQKFVEVSRQRVQIFKLQQEKLKNLIANKILQLKSCVEWATQARHSAFIERVKTPEEVPFNSLRLMQSPNYAPIFEKYSNSRGETLELIQKVLSLFEHIYRGEVRSTWEIYEIWCVVKLYSAFILHANMQPTSSEATLFERIQIGSDGTLQLPKNLPFHLHGKLNNGKNFSIVLVYEPRLRTQNGELRTPDITIDLIIDRKKSKYCFDAKYRNYDKQGCDRIIKDVIDIARDRYLEELDFSSVFILHTDAKKDYWGEIPFHRFLSEEFDLEVGELEYPGHEYGAISLIPGKDEERQTRRILRLLLQYHSNEFCTVCLSCGQQIRLGQDVRSSWKPDRITEEELIERVINKAGGSGNGTGVYCSCPGCGNFWVVQSCYGAHHHLLKFKDCFHRNSDHPELNGKWMYICPECGSDPSPAELRRQI